MSPLRVVPDLEPVSPKTDAEHVSEVIVGIGTQMVHVSEALGALSVAMADATKAIEEYLRVLREYYDAERTRGKGIHK